MKITYVSAQDHNDIHAWSGLIYHIAKALESKYPDIEYLTDLTTTVSSYLKLKARYYKLIGKGYDFNREKIIAQQWAKQITSRMSVNTDVVFSPSSLTLSLLETNKSKVFYGDATFAGLIHSYDDYKQLSKETLTNGNKLEKATLDTCALAIYASDWAAETAIKYYNADPSKVKVVPFGANINCTRTWGDIENLVKGRDRSCCNLLFIGIDWKRKGLETAIKTAAILNDNNIKTVLHVVGPQNLDELDLPAFVVNHGFVSKRTKEGQAYLDRLFSNGHFLILPTKAEAYGLVFCEANSFGVPCLAFQVGGVPTIIKDDINGKLFPTDCREDSFAGYITEQLSGGSFRYEELCYSSFNEYGNRLNWNVASNSLMKLLNEL